MESLSIGQAGSKLGLGDFQVVKLAWAGHLAFDGDGYISARSVEALLSKGLSYEQLTELTNSAEG